jgi:hypothetical protein
LASQIALEAISQQVLNGCHAFADGLQAKEIVQDSCESMQNLQNQHAFAVMNNSRRFANRPRKHGTHGESFPLVVKKTS